MTIRVSIIEAIRVCEVLTYFLAVELDLLGIEDVDLASVGHERFNLLFLLLSFKFTLRGFLLL